MIWWPFAPKPERADTLEVTDLHSGAPLLYSTFFVVKKLFVKWYPHFMAIKAFAEGKLTSFPVPPRGSGALRHIP